MWSITSLLELNTRYNGVFFKHITTIYTSCMSSSFVEFDVLQSELKKQRYTWKDIMFEESMTKEQITQTRLKWLWRQRWKGRTVQSFFTLEPHSLHIKPVGCWDEELLASVAIKEEVDKAEIDSYFSLIDSKSHSYLSFLSPRVPCLCRLFVQVDHSTQVLKCLLHDNNYYRTT